jgi:hypothetical protein
VTADPALAALVERRKRLGLDSEHHGSPSGLLTVHVDALRRAGFAEIGTLWQRGDNRLLCGVLGGVVRTGRSSLRDAEVIAGVQQAGEDDAQGGHGL